MPRSLVLAIFLASSACAAGIWPEKLGEYQRKSTSPGDLGPDDHARWGENGLEAVERADYGSFKVAAWRFKDATGAYAGYLELLQPYISSFLVGNYLVQCQGECPKGLPQLADASLPHISHGSAPTLSAYFPLKNLVPRSERYVLGPEGLTYAREIFLPHAVHGTPATTAV
jgi:hypothetical protein